MSTATVRGGAGDPALLRSAESDDLASCEPLPVLHIYYCVSRWSSDLWLATLRHTIVFLCSGPVQLYCYQGKPNLCFE